MNATGKLLMPGLAEVHAHLTGGNDGLNQRILLLNIARGVAVRGVWVPKGEIEAKLAALAPM